MSQLLALSWPKRPCALKAAIGIGKQTLAPLASSAAPEGGCGKGPPAIDEAGAPSHCPNGGVADSLDEAKAAFRAAGDAMRTGKATFRERRSGP
jgi:hypothetical protein